MSKNKPAVVAPRYPRYEIFLFVVAAAVAVVAVVDCMRASFRVSGSTHTTSEKHRTGRDVHRCTVGNMACEAIVSAVSVNN